MTNQGIELLQKIMAADPEKLLRPEAILREARAKTSPLHRYFQWDDAIAGHQYRLVQARALLQRIKIVNPEALDAPPRLMFISLREDQHTPGGGYRLVDDVITSDVLRQEFLLTAQRDLQAWAHRYRMLEELVKPVMQAAEKAAAIMDTVTPRAKRKKKLVAG